MSSNDVAVRGPSSALAIADGQTGFTEQQVSALEQLGVKDAGPGDLAVFFHQATRTGLDPFAKQIYMIGRWSRDGVKQTIQTGIDGYRLIARRAADRSHEALEYEDTLWCGTDGAWRDVWLAQGPPAAAKVTVLRNGGRFPAIAMWNEYVQTNRDGSPNAMWARMGAGQLAKCAEALALRKAFPQDLSGIYTDEEMGQADARAEQGAGAAEVPSQRVTPPRAGQRVIDGETAPAAPSIPDGEEDSTGRDCSQWLTTIAGLSNLEAARGLWIETGKETLARDCGGVPLYRRLEARMAELKADEDRAAAAAAPVADDEGPVDVPEGVGEPIVPDTGDGTVEAPLEGDVVDAADAPPAEADPEDLRRDTASRRATITELTRLFAGRAVMDAACEQVFGLHPDNVGTNRLRKWMGDLQRDTKPA